MMQVKLTQQLGEDLVSEVARQNYDEARALALIAQGACVKQRDGRDGTALIYACRWGRAEIARLLIEGGAPLNAKDRDGKTALICAAFHGYADIVEMLIRRGADINLGNRNGMLPAALAKSAGHSAVVGLLEKEAVIRYGYIRGNLQAMRDKRINPPRLRRRPS